MRLRVYVLSFGVVSALAASPRPADAQEYRGRVQGVVADESKSAVGDAKVTLINEATGVQLSRQSGRDGRYLFDYVDPGTYTLRVEFTGFNISEHKNIKMQHRGDVTVDVTLKVGDFEETLTVLEAPVAVQFNTSSMDLTVEQKLVQELPLLTRNPYRLALLDPAVMAAGNPNEVSAYHHRSGNEIDVGGGGSLKNDVMLDGTPLMAGPKIAYTPPMDAVTEFTIQQNSIDAEHGHSAGGIVSLSMKSGTNEYHGTAYFVGRDPDLNATSDRTRHTHNENTHALGGGTLGMPIKKDRVFLFTAFEMSKTTEVIPGQYTLPTEQERQGDFSRSFNADGTLRVIYDPWSAVQDPVTGAIRRTPFPGNRIPRDRFDPLAARLLAGLWPPNGPGDDRTGLNNFKYEDSREFNYWNLSSRVDWQINDRWKMFARASGFHTVQDSPDYTGGDPFRMRNAVGSLRHGLNIAADTVYTINNSTTLDLRAAYFKVTDRRDLESTKIGEDGYRDLWSDGWWEPYMSGRPAVYFPNLSFAGGVGEFGVRNFWYQDPTGYSFHGRLTKYLSKHSIKAGTEVRLKRGEAARFFFTQLNFSAAPTADTPTSPNLNRVGHPWAGFLLGAMDPSSQTQFTRIQVANTEMIAAYIQDDFRVTNKLTLNLGLRYEYEGGFWNPDNSLPRNLDLSVPIPGTAEAIDPRIPADVRAWMAESTGARSHSYTGAWNFTEEGSNRTWDAPTLTFMPRAGFALRLNDTTAIRGGYGRFVVPSTQVDPDNDNLGQIVIPGFTPITTVRPYVQGRPQATLSNPFPLRDAPLAGTTTTLPANPLNPLIGKQLGRYTNLGDSLVWRALEQRPPINDRVSLSVQKEFWGRTIVDVTYFVNFQSRVPYNKNMNMADPALRYRYGHQLDVTVPNPFRDFGTPETFPGPLRARATVTKGELLRPHPHYGNLTQNATNGRKARYQSFQVRLQRPFHGGFAFMTAYAYIRARDQEFFNDLDEYNERFTWVPNPQPRHRATLAATFEIPVGRGRRFLSDMPKAADRLIGGWQLSAIGSYNSGSLLMFGPMRENEPGTNPRLANPEGGVGRLWFQTRRADGSALFSPLPANTPRSNPRYYDGLYGPSFRNVDATLSKHFKLNQRFNLELRLEVYNAFNNLNWAALGPNQLNVSNSAFGTTTLPAAGHFGRQLQYTLRLAF